MTRLVAYLAVSLFSYIHRFLLWFYQKSRWLWYEKHFKIKMYYFKVPTRESSHLSTTQHEHTDLRINAQTIVVLLGPASTLEKFSPLSALH